MAYSSDKLYGARVGLIAAAAPATYQYSCQAHEVQTHRLVLVCSAVSAGVNVGNPIGVAMYHSFDNGATWVALTNTETTSLYAAGTVTIGPGPNSPVVGPLVKVVVTPPSGQTCTLSDVLLTKVTGHFPHVMPSPTSIASTPTGVSFTTSGDAVTATYGATTDVWALRTGGVAGSVLQTITVTYSDVTKTAITSIVRT